MRELDGGGATVTNPDGSSIVGNVVALTSSTGGQQYHVAGRVIRTSRADTDLHVRFEAMKDEQRAQIAGSVAAVGGGQDQ